ncbi:DNA-binding response regulator [Anabaenopsis sp. FSS-46]|uniref:response regulator transcription factor n=1 Tax=Anabaenopsis sp. FSS-46 TaxID=2971766 RepID=UPI0024743A37|nr:DNA-binding response regulator [Anabaenopsis sp. FSS-46]MDH6097483.1 DNA-binding response regulator [Anabaenopsis sp. FSS-46]
MKYESVKKILVIEDDHVTRHLYAQGLEAKGFDIINAQNGLAGIQQAQEYVPDLVLCDLTMPDIDGYTVLTMLRQDPVTAIIPFIFITGSCTREAIRKGMELGADDYVTKPFSLDELLRAINTQLQRQAVLKTWCAAKFQEAQKSGSADKTTALNSPQSIFPCVPQLKKVFEFIEAHYHEGITLCDVAEAVGYSPAYLTNQVGKQTGETVNSWIVKRRMQGARFLLQNDYQTVEQIARALGYQDVSHFSRQFRQHHGLPPHAWRKEHQVGCFKVELNN